MKYSAITDGDTRSRGYNKFSEMAEDVEKLVDLVWVSGTSKYSLPRPAKTRLIIA